MRVDGNQGSSPNYEPNSFDGLRSGGPFSPLATPTR
jgi:hypothetical protein